MCACCQDCWYEIDFWCSLRQDILSFSIPLFDDMHLELFLPAAEYNHGLAFYFAGTL